MVLAADSSADQLKALVELNSGSSNAAGVANVQTAVATELKKLGFDVQMDEYHFVVGQLAGVPNKTVTLIMHADTVFEPFHPFQHWKLSADEKTAVGPGVIDDKGGIVVALEGLRKFLNNRKPPFSIRVISAPQEEIGSPHHLDKFREWAKDSWITLSFEPGLDDGSIIESRRGDRWYHIKTVGKEAHAGRSHKEGINACNDLATKLGEISKLTDYDKGVTVSIGHMEGGKDKYNIVCGAAEAKVDVRFSDIPSRETVHKKIVAILNKVVVKGAATTFELEDDCPPFAKSRAVEPFLNRYLAIISKIENRKVGSQKSGGAADSNYFSRDGAIIIDGLGAVGGKMHTSEEFVTLSTLTSRAEALNQFLQTLK